MCHLTLFGLFIMNLQSLLSHSAKLFSIMLKSPQASDILASQYFRQKKYIGSNDRKFISESIFSTLRMKNLSEVCVSSFQPIQQEHRNILIIASTLIIIQNVDSYSDIFNPMKILKRLSGSSALNINELMSFTLDELNIFDSGVSKDFVRIVINNFKLINSRSLDILSSTSVPTLEQQKVLGNRYSMPSWILNDWVNNKAHNLTWKQACQLADSFLFPAPLCLRVNTNITSVEKVVQNLQSQGIDCKQGHLSPFSVIINQRINLRQNDLVKHGIIEVQDEGSQIISLSLAPEPNTTVLDACAGAGGKSLHIASLQNDSGRIFASDIELRKLRELNKRSKRSGFNSIKTILVNHKSSDKMSYNSFDYVLIDAPCSGSGTFRRSPFQKWKLKKSLVSRIARKQFKILMEYSKYLKPGGILVYSTCSILPEENDEMINKFLAETDNFEKSPIKPALQKYGVEINGLNDEDFSLSLTPYKHGCDGFYMARLCKINDKELLR